MPPNTVSVTRPGKWGNPFKIGMVIREPDTNDYITTLNTMADVLKWYRRYLKYTNKHDEIVSELKGKNLACFCKEGEPCHADILLKIANS